MMRAFTIIASVLFLTLLINPHAYAFGKKSPAPAPSPSVSPTATATASPPSFSPSPTIAPSSTPAKQWWSTASGADLRSCDGPIENQQTPWCTAFSFTGILENMICDHNRLSIHHTWSFYEEYSVESAAASVPGHKITNWSDWSESADAPIVTYLNDAHHALSSMKEIDSDDDVQAAFNVLDSGKPVYVGMAVPADMASCYSIIRPTTKITDGGHALEIVGYGKDAKAGGGAYFIIKQSWGPDCGDGGYQYMPVSVCDLQNMYCEFFEPGKVI